MRLVPNQTNEEITEKFTKFFKSIAPKAVKVKVAPHHGGEPYVSPTGIPAYKSASKAMETTYGKKPVPVRSGGSIPIVALFEAELGVKSILLGFGLDSDAIHSLMNIMEYSITSKELKQFPIFLQILQKSIKPLNYSKNNEIPI